MKRKEQQLSSIRTEEIFKLGKSVRSEIARLHLSTRRSLNSDLVGQYRSAFRGQGLLLSDLREYQPGDDLKHIHWKASARSGKMYVKSFEEERELRIMLAIDISNSTNYGKDKSNFQRALEFSAAVTALAQSAQDSVGLCLFSDAVHEFIPPAKTRCNFHRMVQVLCNDRPFASQTDLNSVLNFLNEKFRKHLIIFVISDFISKPFLSSLKPLALRHDVILVALLDPTEMSLPAVGLVDFQDSESKDRLLIDTSSTKAKESMRKFQNRRMMGISSIAHQADCDFVVVKDNPIRSLVALMKARIGKLR